jgi:hypothetical protein
VRRSTQAAPAQQLAPAVAAQAPSETVTAAMPAAEVQAPETKLPAAIECNRVQLKSCDAAVPAAAAAAAAAPGSPAPTIRRDDTIACGTPNARRLVLMDLLSPASKALSNRRMALARGADAVPGTPRQFPRGPSRLRRTISLEALQPEQSQPVPVAAVVDDDISLDGDSVDNKAADEPAGHTDFTATAREAFVALAPSVSSPSIVGVAAAEPAVASTTITSQAICLEAGAAGRAPLPERLRAHLRPRSMLAMLRTLPAALRRRSVADAIAHPATPVTTISAAPAAAVQSPRTPTSTMRRPLLSISLNAGSPNGSKEIPASLKAAPPPPTFPEPATLASLRARRQSAALLAEATRPVSFAITGSEIEELYL